MDRNKFSIKVNVIEGLLSAKSVFDRGALGDIDGVPMFVNAFWFDNSLSIKYIEVSAVRDGKAPESLFMAPAAVFLFGEELTIPKSGNFLKIAAGNYSKLNTGRGELACISGQAVAGETVVRVGEEDFLARDFLIDTRAWKLAGIMRGNWTSPEITRVSGLLGFEGQTRYEFTA
jgi:hypothetical protein